MRRIIFSPLVAVLALLFLLPASTVRADVVRLKNGLVFEGRIVKERYGNVTIETKDGTFEFKRLNILRVERDYQGVPSNPSSANSQRGSYSSRTSTKSAGRTTDSRRDVSTQASKASKASKKKKSSRRGSRSSKKKMEKLLGEIESIRFAPWQKESTHRATENMSGRYKFQNSAGVLLFDDQRPRSSKGIAKLWAKRQCDAGPDHVVIGCWEWVRLYWDPERRKWTSVDPRLQAFQRETAKIRTILDLAAGRGGARATNIAVTAGTMRRTNSSAEFEKKKARLLQLTREAAGEWGGGDLLAEAHLLNLHIRKAQSSAEKIHFARKRRAVVRKLVRAFPND